MSVAFVTARPEGAQAWWRCTVPARALARAGVGAVACGAWKQRRDGRVIGSAELAGGGGSSRNFSPRVVVLRGWVPPDAAAFMGGAHEAGQAVAVDIDDDLWRIAPDNPDAEVMPSLIGQWERSLAEADAVIASTPNVADAVLEHVGRPATVIGNYVDTRERWPRPEPRRLPRLAWIGKSDFRGGDVAMIADALRANIHAFELMHVGWEPGDPTLSELVGFDCAPHPAPWIHPANLARFIAAHCDVVVIPYRLDAAHVHNLSHTAILGEACSLAGVPFVASPIPSYVELAERGAGWIAETASDWHRDLRSLSRDPVVRHAVGDTARAAVERHYDIHAHVADWRDALDIREVASGRR